MNRYARLWIGFTIAYSSYAFAQLPTLPTSTNLLHILVVEAQIEDSLLFVQLGLQASDDYSTFSLTNVLELDLLTYDRDDWEDFDGDCQNTRHELLIATSEVGVTFTKASKCTVATGQWLDPYTGNTYTLASDLDIDHVIPLNFAHRHGGAVWSAFVKKLFQMILKSYLSLTTERINPRARKGRVSGCHLLSHIIASTFGSGISWCKSMSWFWLRRI